MKAHRHAEILAYTPDTVTVAAARLAPLTTNSGTGLLVFRCPFCCGKNRGDGVHVHGAAIGDRIPHCLCDRCRHRSHNCRKGKLSHEAQAIAEQLRENWKFILRETKDPRQAGDLPQPLLRRVAACKQHKPGDNL